MKINVELTDDERDALLLIMGIGTGAVIQMGQVNAARAGIRALNKMFANSPEYVPYDENSFEEYAITFPFKRVEPQ